MPGIVRTLASPQPKLAFAVVAGAVGAALVAGFCATASGRPSRIQHPTSSPAAGVHVPPVILGQINPQGTAVNAKTGTLYVLTSPDQDGVRGDVIALAVASCNAHRDAGCGQTTNGDLVGLGPTALAVDQATDTIYVANMRSNTVSVIDGATCNDSDTSGCGAAEPVVRVGSNPVALDVDQATGTVYVANLGQGSGARVSLIDGRTCDSRVTTGCGHVPAQLTVGAGVDGVLADQATGTVYVASVGGNGAITVSLIDAATCNARVTVGCASQPASVRAGLGTPDSNVAMAVDQVTRTLYVANWSSGTLTMIDIDRCTAKDTSGCPRHSRTVAVGPGPAAIAIDAATSTIYVADTGGSAVAVLDAATCNSTATSGCRVLERQAATR